MRNERGGWERKVKPMPVVTMTTTGNFSKTEKFLQRCLNIFDISKFDKYGKKGVEALKANTPVDTGLLKDSWYYDVEFTKERIEITWYNGDIENGYNVAILIQYGHATKNGSWVEGVDFVNPAMAEIFEDMADEIWTEVTNA